MKPPKAVATAALQPLLALQEVAADRKITEEMLAAAGVGHVLKQA